MPAIHLKTFNLNQIKEDRIVILVAPRGSGKSTLLRDILYTKRHLPMGLVFSATEESNNFYQEIVPDCFVFNDWYPDAVERLMSRQKDKCKAYGDPNGQYQVGDSRFKHHPVAFIVAEDCMSDKAAWKSKCIRDIFLNGRHRKCFLMISLQYCMDLSIDLRNNVDYVFALMEDSMQSKERMYKNFFSVFPTFDMFCQVFDQCTHDYGCIVLDKTIKSSKIEDKVFYYKAQKPPPFKMGCWQFWEYDRRRNKAYQADAKDDDDGGHDALQEVAKARSGNKPIIKVVKEEPPPREPDPYYEEPMAYPQPGRFQTDPYAQPRDPYERLDYYDDYGQDGYGYEPAQQGYAYPEDSWEDDYY